MRLTMVLLGSEKRRLLESLDSICKLCNEVLQNKPENEADVTNFKASCTSLAAEIHDNKLFETKSIEDLTNSLGKFMIYKISQNSLIA